MNDKISRFTNQLSGASPIPPELEGRSAPTSRTPITAVRIGIAVAAVATLTAVGLISTRGSDTRESVAPAASSGSSVSDAIDSALPDGFSLLYVERGGNASAAHAVAVNARFDVLDIEIIATGAAPDVATETPVNGPSAEPPVDCQTVESPESDPLCVGIIPASPLPEGDGVAASTGCIVYAPSTDEVPPSLPADCTVVADPNLPGMTIPGSGPVGEVQAVDGEILSSTHYFDTGDGGVPAPFGGATAQGDTAFVGVALYGINRPVDTQAFANDLLQNVSAIDDLSAAIAALPLALAPVDPSLSAPLDASWSGRGLKIGSLSVSLVTKAPSNETAGSVIVRVSFPGSLTGSGNDGSVYWHATTGADGRTYIASYRPGDDDMITPADATALTQKFAEEGWGEVAAAIEVAGSYPATTIEVVGDSASTTTP